MKLLTPFVCPVCYTELQQTSPNELSCAKDGCHFVCMDGIWRFLLPERAPYFEKFIQEYETIRKAEGRSSQSAAYYQALPYQDLNKNMSADWHIRAASFDLLLKKVIGPLEQPGRPLKLLDLGAGNGWLSNQLALRGHQVAAVDLMTNAFDGLACKDYYQSDFTALQAEFDRLPFPNETADLVIFNASLHYSVDIKKTLAEALRVLTTQGLLVILDSPVYRDARSGEKMVQERANQFTQRFGFPSMALPSQNYLTYQFLQTLEITFSIHWEFLTPYYGLRWVLRPLKAWLRGTREPAKFHLLIGKKPA
jgi:ubiquinone/menaquinone biosynthesis C-methylase UbiE